MFISADSFTKFFINMSSNSTFSRRTFIKSSAAGVTGAMAMGAAFSGVAAIKNEIDLDKIVYRDLGKTGLKLPVVSMGVMRSDNPNLVKAALRSGISHLDTAHGYQGGRNEEMLGRLLREFPRESFVIATKIRGEGENELPDAEVEARFLGNFEISLRRLQMEYVDILYLHSASSREYTLHPAYLSAMKKLVESGRVRFTGVSTHSNEPEVITAVAESNFYNVVLTSYNFQQKHLPDLNAAIETASKAGVGVVAMKTMAGGYMDKDRTTKVNARAALKWALQNEHINTAIPGFTSFDEMEESWSVVTDLELTDQEKRDLQLSYNRGSMYCNGCRTCLAQCPQKLAIPDAMRAYMYAYGYGQTRDARNLLAEVGIDRQACSDCNKCDVQGCPQQFDIKTKMQDITRLLDVPSEFMV